MSWRKVKKLINCAISTAVVLTVLNFGTVIKWHNELTGITPKQDTQEKITTAITEVIPSPSDADIQTQTEETVQAGQDIVDTVKEIGTEDGLELEYAKFIRVVDGDTIVVEIDGNDNVKVRMIGIDTPESVASEEYLERSGKESCEEGVAASDYLKEYMASLDSEYIYLQTDVSDEDCYGRKLRYVWVEIPDPSEMYDIDYISENMLNAMMLDEGYAVTATYKPDTSYAEIFEEIENR